MGLTIFSQLSNQAAGTSLSQGDPPGKNPGETPLLLGAMQYSFLGDLQRHNIPSNEEGYVDAQGYIEHPQSSTDCWVNGPGCDLQLPGYGYETNDEARNMIDHSESPASGSLRFNP